MASKSPKRHTFQVNNYIERCKDEGKEPNSDYLDFWKSVSQQDDENMANPEWQKNNLEYDLRSTDWILDKARATETYAQNLYAALCNNEFTKNDVWPILKGEKWACSWRHAGGIVADMREEGDYIDWYCSGMGSGLGNGDESGAKDYVSESFVTDEIRQDLLKLGWIVSDTCSDE